MADWWSLQKLRAAQGDPQAHQHLDYGFLTDVIPAGEPARVRRAEATIAKFAHLPRGRETAG